MAMITVPWPRARGDQLNSKTGYCRDIVCPLPHFLSTHCDTPCHARSRWIHPCFELTLSSTGLTTGLNCPRMKGYSLKNIIPLKGEASFSTTDVNAAIFPWNLKEGSGGIQEKKKWRVFFFRKNACPSLRRTSSTRGSFHSSYVSGMLLSRNFFTTQFSKCTWNRIYTGYQVIYHIQFKVF